MGRKTLPPHKHPTHFKIMMALSQRPLSSYKVAKMLNFSQSNIYDFIRGGLLKEGYILKGNKEHSYFLNKDKIKNQYLDSIYDDPNLSEIINSLPEKKVMFENKYFNFKFEESLRQLHEHITLIDNETLEDYYYFFNKIIRNSQMDTFNTIQAIRAEGKLGIKDMFIVEWDKFFGKQDLDYRDYHQFMLNLPHKIRIFDFLDFKIGEAFGQLLLEGTPKIRKKFIKHWKKIRPSSSPRLSPSSRKAKESHP